MAFLTQPDVLPEAMRFIVRLLLRSEDPIPESDLLRLIAPAGLVEAIKDEETASKSEFRTGGLKIAMDSLAAMRAAGLVELTTDGVHLLQLASHVRDEFSSWEALEADVFAEFLRKAVVAPAGDLFDDDPEGGAEDLARAVALLMSIPRPLVPIASFDTGNGKTLADFQTRHLGDDIANWIVRNRERYPALIRWVSYLGYSRLDNNGRILVDPSVALRSSVNAIVQGEMDLLKFMDQLGTAVSPTDRGRIGRDVCEQLQTYDSRAELSPGVALGLLTLHHRGVISLTNRDDAESLKFPVVEGENMRYSHISLVVKK